MPERETIKRAREDAREGKSPSTQAGEFVREEMDHIREGIHGARSTKQAIAIGLSKARRAGVKLPLPARGRVSSGTLAQARRDNQKGRKSSHNKPSPKRSRAVFKALQREGHSAASPESLARQARHSALAWGPVARRRAALKAVKTKGHKGLQQAARKAARTRAANSQPGISPSWRARAGSRKR